MPKPSQGERKGAAMAKATTSTETIEPAPSVPEEAQAQEPVAIDAEDDSAAPAAHGSMAAPRPSPPNWSFHPPRDDSDSAARNVAGRPRVPATPSPVAPPVTTPSVSLGPIGKRRSPAAVVILSVLTLGVYALIWHKRINTEMGDFDTRMHVRPGRSAIAVAIPWLLGLLVSLAGAARIVLDQLHVGLPFDPHFSITQAYFLLAGLLVVPYLELALAFSAAAVVMTLERLRTAEDRSGLTTDVQVRPTEAAWLLIIPVVGGLALLALVQRRLNAVWEQTLPSPVARISQY
jgi:hypothetical protein